MFAMFEGTNGKPRAVCVLHVEQLRDVKKGVIGLLMTSGVEVEVKGTLREAADTLHGAAAAYTASVAGASADATMHAIVNAEASARAARDGSRAAERVADELAEAAAAGDPAALALYEDAPRASKPKRKRRWF